MDKIKYILALLGGMAVSYLEQYLLLYLLVGAAVVMDLISGMAAAVIEGTGLSSSTARRGFFKKLMLLFAVAFGTFLDVLLPWCMATVGLTVEGRLYFGAIIGAYICIGECISILENIYRSTGRKLPVLVEKTLQIAKEKLDEK